MPMPASKPDFDVLIIGGGPAGAAAALTLRKRPDIKVLVMERGDYKQDKVGEALSPGTRELLRYLGVWEAFSGQQQLSIWGNQAAWGSDELHCLDFIFTLHGSGWGLNRRAFEQLLADAVQQQGGELWTQSRVEQLARTEAGWQVQVTDAQGQLRHLTCRYVIDAAGRASPWSLQAGAVRVRYDNLMGLANWLPRADGQQTEAFTLVEACEYGWWYGSPLPDGRLAVSLMSDQGLIQQQRLAKGDAWFALLAGTRHLRRLVSLDGPQPAPRASPAYSARLTPPHNAPIIAAGDAVASHDPLSASGIPRALATGIQAARAAADALFGDGKLKKAYHDAVAQDFGQYLGNHWRIYQAEQRWPRADFWRFRTAQPQLAPTTLVGRGRAQESLFVPDKVARRLLELAANPQPAHQLLAGLRAEQPDLPVERLLLAMEELLAPA